MSATSAIIPPRLERGQTIGVCAPAGPIPAERLRAGLERLGDFRLRVTPSVTAPRASGVPDYLSASDDVRADELASLLADPDVRAIVLARGGYGITRILSRLDPDALRRDPKPIVGFSDATALLAWAYAAGVRGIHGPMIGVLGELPAGDVARLIEILTVPRAPGAVAWTLAAHGRGTHRGHLVAANLTLASMLAHTPWPLPLAGSIAILEEVGEVPYEIDRYLTQLRQVGALDGVRAAIVGDLARCHKASAPDAGNDAALATMLERLAPIPTAVGAPIGHGSRNEAVAFGATCTLDLETCTFQILEPAVA